MLTEFGTAARGLARNPLGIIALFIVLVYGLACLVVITGGSLSLYERIPIVYFLIVFPFVVLGVFTYLVSSKADQLFAPGDFRNEATYLELQRMRVSAVASLSAAATRKGVASQSPVGDLSVENVVRRVNSALDLASKSSDKPIVLWVDDNPSNNIYERDAMEAVGVDFVLAETTADALSLLYKSTFQAVISDMGRREGPREGYALLDSMRARGDKTPLFFFASSNAPEHKKETLEHGGQGCTNDGQELFEMVTRAVFRPQSGQVFASRKRATRG